MKKNEVKAYSVDIVIQHYDFTIAKKLIVLAGELPGFYGINPQSVEKDMILHALYDSTAHRNEAYNYLTEQNDDERILIAVNMQTAYIDKKFATKRYS